MKFRFAVILSFFTAIAFSQEKMDFAKVDSISKTVKYHGDIKGLAYDLTKNYDAQMDKARAIFIWITENIGYDCRAYNNRKPPKPIKCKDADDCKAKIAKQQEDYLKRVIIKKKGICEGYAQLFKTMCGYSGIECSVVSGFTKDHPSQIGRMGPLDHAWNFMLIDGKPYWLDVTWAAGGCIRNEKTGRLKRFVKSFNDYYWLTPLERFSRNHFPKDTTLLAATTITKRQYKNAAYIPGYKLPSIEILAPESGVLNVKLGDTIRFSIREQATYDTDKIQMNTNVRVNPETWYLDMGGNIREDPEMIKKQRYIPFEKKGDLYHFIYVADDLKVRYMDILFDTSLVARFKIKVSK